jgi:hypothetical protein
MEVTKAVETPCIWLHLANDLEVSARDEHTNYSSTDCIAGEHDTTADDVIPSNEDDVPSSPHLQHLRRVADQVRRCATH